ncbi:MAG: GntR family transcriptional regulator [Bacillota bacterium]
MTINYDTARPIYEQIIEYILKKLAAGKFSPGEKLPSQRQMAQELKVNPNTVQRSYREMENKGLVETKRGLGTFVTDSSEDIENIRAEMAAEMVKNFLNEMQALGYTRTQIEHLVAGYFRQVKEEK